MIKAICASGGLGKSFFDILEEVIEKEKTTVETLLACKGYEIESEEKAGMRKQGNQINGFNNFD